MKKNIFLTGAPSVGKTTIIKKIIKELTLKSNGFFTEEVCKEGRRVGFMMHTLDGKSAYLAHETIISDQHIRRFGVSLENIEKIAVPSILPQGNPVIILDEIGKMECFSLPFQAAAKAALDSSSLVIGTITLGGSDFILEVKSRPDMEIVEVTKDNRDLLPAQILESI